MTTDGVTEVGRKKIAVANFVTIRIFCIAFQYFTEYYHHMSFCSFIVFIFLKLEYFLGGGPHLEVRKRIS